VNTQEQAIYQRFMTKTPRVRKNALTQSYLNTGSRGMWMGKRKFRKILKHFKNR